DSVTNRSTATLSCSDIAVSNGYAIATNTCGATLAAGASCSVGVTFSPTANGTVNGTLTFTDSAQTSPQTVSLTGSGVAPVTLSATSLSFSTTVVGNTSSSRSVTLTNHQTVPLNFKSIAASAGFAVATNTCGSSIGAGASCVVGVTFSPTAVGSATGSVAFVDDAGTQSVALSGTGSASITFSSSTLSFGTVTVGTTSS